MSTKFPLHSPLGASSAERWMNCPGSNVILRQLTLPESDEADWQKEGVAAHEAAAYCLRNHLDTWEINGREFNGVKVDDEMAEAIQLYLDTIRGSRVSKPLIRSMVEERITGSFSPLFYGTVDDGEFFAKDNGDQASIEVNDLKYGVGIAVDAVNNPQLKYYALGIIDRVMIDADAPVTLRIIQPRAFHPDGPIRAWATTVGDILKWKDEELVPAMARAEYDTTLNPGEWCRFCPAKLACPMLTALFKAAASTSAAILPNIEGPSLAINYRLSAAAKHFLHALDAEVDRRLNSNMEVSDGTPEGTFKLVPKKSNRVFSNEGVSILKKGERFPKKDVYELSLKSPRQIDLLGRDGKKFTAEYAYSPFTGTTVAPSTDPRAAVRKPDTKAKFTSYAEGIEYDEEKSN